MKAQAILENNDNESSVYPLIQMSYYFSAQQRRQLLNTMLVILREYSHCSIANQLCIMILDAAKSLFDVIDIVTMQKFIIGEFSARHQVLSEMHQANREAGNTRIIKRYQIDHLNMQSA